MQRSLIIKQIWNASFLLNLYKDKLNNCLCEPLYRQASFSQKKKKSDVKLLAASAQRLPESRGACGGLNYGVRVRKGVL